MIALFTYRDCSLSLLQDCVLSLLRPINCSILRELDDKLSSGDNTEDTGESFTGSQGSVVHSHWSSSNEARLSLVDSFRVLLAPAILCHKEIARTKPPNT